MPRLLGGECRPFQYTGPPHLIFPLQLSLRNVNRLRDFPLNLPMGNKSPSPLTAGTWMLHEQISWIFFICLGEQNVLPSRKLPTTCSRFYWVNKGRSRISRGKTGLSPLGKAPAPNICGCTWLVFLQFPSFSLHYQLFFQIIHFSGGILSILIIFSANSRSDNPHDFAIAESVSCSSFVIS